MIIYFDPKTYHFLHTYVIKPGNIELELRFGNYDKDGNFKPDIGLETFTKFHFHSLYLLNLHEDNINKERYVPSFP